MKRSSFTAAAALFLAGGILAAEAPNIGGTLFADLYFSSLSTADPFTQASTIGWLNLSQKLNERSSAVFIAEGRVIESSSGNGRAITGLGIREGYMTYSLGGLDVSAGKQIIAWGKTDVVSPTDFLSGKDYTLFNPDDEVRRVGSTAVKADYTLQKWTLTGVFVPVPAFSTVLLPGSLLAVAGVSAHPIIYPTASLANSEVALRLSYFDAGWDIAFIGFHGWGKIPEFDGEVDSLGNTYVIPLPHKIDALGLNASWSPGNFVFRAEGAYTRTENNDGYNYLVQPSYAEAVLGVEYAFDPSWHLQVQAVDKYIPNFVAVPDPNDFPIGASQIAPGTGTLNSVILGYQVKNRFGGTARLHYRAEKAHWEAECFAMFYRPAGYFLRPKVSFDLTDTLKATVGADYYGGDQRSQLGALHAYSSFFFEGKYTF